MFSYILNYISYHIITYTTNFRSLSSFLSLLLTLLTPSVWCAVLCRVILLKNIRFKKIRIMWLKFEILRGFFCFFFSTRAVDKEKRRFSRLESREIMRNTKRSNIEGFVVENWKKHREPQNIYVCVFTFEEINLQFHTAENPLAIHS